MKKILSLLAIVTIVGCGSRYDRAEKDDNGKQVVLGINVITVNKCQYVLWRKISSATMVHAGNCNNPEHKK